MLRSQLESKTTTSLRERTAKPVAAHISLLSLPILSGLEEICKWNSLPMISASHTPKSSEHGRAMYPRTFLRDVRFRGKKHMQMRVTDKTYPGDIMVWVETAQHSKQCFSTSSHLRGRSRCSQLLFAQSAEAPPCLCWSYPSAYFPRAEISSSCHS